MYGFSTVFENLKTYGNHPPDHAIFNLVMRVQYYLLFACGFWVQGFV
jgi:hypothetical protein